MLLYKEYMYLVAHYLMQSLELFALALGFIVGVVIGSLINKRKLQHQELQLQEKHNYSAILKPIIYSQYSPQSLVLSYSLSTGQSFQLNGVRSKLFKGHIYQYLPLTLSQSQQGQFNSFAKIKSTITKIYNDGQQTKLYNSSFRVPKEGRFYFNINVVNNEYLVRRQGSQRGSNAAVTKTDIVFGFFITQQHLNQATISQKIKQICQESQRQSLNISGILAYGFNGRIYNNGDLMTEQKMIKKNKQLSVLINRDEGFIAFQLEEEAVGFIVIPQDKCQMVPFVQMYAVGSAVIING